MRIFKKTVAALLALCLLASCAFASSAAMSVSSGIGELRKQWSRGEGPAVDGFDIDYSYFSPIENGASADKNYPLFIFLGGASEGTYQGKELTANNFAYWSGAENQAKFNNGGAYLLIARAPEEVLVFWDTCPITSLKAAVDDFIANKGANVDMDRIYIVGWCLGACGAARMAVEYSDFIAGLVAISPRYTLSRGEADKLRNTAVWVLGCTADSYSTYAAYTETMWNNVRSAAVDKTKVRLTKCTSAPDAALLLNHDLWTLVTSDMQQTSSYKGLSTIDGNGNTVESPEIINWMSSMTLTESKACSCNCHSSSFFVQLIWKIKAIFCKLFNISDGRICECSREHW